jgi:hypothetical protein
MTVEVHAEQAELAEGPDQLPGLLDDARLEPLGDVRLDLVGEHGAHRVADRDLLGAQEVVDRQRVEPVERRRGVLAHDNTVQASAT